jgi:glutathione S-transferase
VKLYTGNFSPNALRTRAVIYELDIEVEQIEVSLRTGDNKTPEYLKLNPNAKVPVLVDGDVVIWESRAINAYLESKFPKAGLYPTNLAQRALIDQWSYWQAIHLGPAMQRVVFERIYKLAFGRGQPDEKVIADEMKNVEQFLGVFDNGLADGREWIVGHLSLADFALASTFMNRVRGGISLDRRPRVAAWIARMEQRDSWRRATAEIPPIPKPAAAA